MVLGIVGGVIAGCNPPAEGDKTQAATAGDAGKTEGK
jgi:hypothetical protein